MEAIRILLTDSCNLRCGYCYQRPFGYEGVRMSQEVADTTARLFHTYARHRDPTKKPRITFSGGEILLHDGLMRHIVETWGDAFRYGCVTNGTLLAKRPDFLEFIRAHGIVLGISLDGTEESHDRNRKTAQGKGTHADIMIAVRQMRGYERFAANMVVMSNTVKDLTRNILFLVEQDIRKISLGPDQDGDMDFAREFMRQVILFYQFVHANYSPIERQNIFARVQLVRSLACVDMSYNYASVDPSGNVYACGTARNFFKPFCLGNVMEKGEYIFANYDELVRQAHKKYAYGEGILDNDIPICSVMDADYRVVASRVQYWKYFSATRKYVREKYGIETANFMGSNPQRI